MPTSALPVEDVLPQLRAALHSHASAVLRAPPGAGKSTLVPLALLGEDWVRGRKLLLLEPRRVAARAVAQRMADTLREHVGATVGYRVRLDSRVSARTRIEVVTEGVLTRMLHDDPALEGVAAVLFDEFHERSLQADLGLALTLDARRQLGTDLRVLVMSATIEGAAVTRLLGDAVRIESDGRAFAVETIYGAEGSPALPGDAESPELRVARLVRRALHEQDGDVLVFLPGWSEIRRLGAMLAEAPCKVVVLHGELPAAEQDAVLRGADPGVRRVVLATNVAETSVTIPGITVVVDSGLVRRAVFDPGTGMSRLETRRISRASAEQRQGRAGRTQPGVCYRAWSEGAQRSLAAFTPAEIVEADLAPLALDLARWGVLRADELAWLDAPPPAMLDSARELLHRLGVLDDADRLTAAGRELAALPLHPRLGAMLRRARAAGATRLGSELAALLSERDLQRAPGAQREADVLLRLDLLRRRDGSGAVANVRRMATQFERLAAANAPAVASSSVADGCTPGALLACAYPDRIARRRDPGNGRFLLANGRGAVFAHPDRLAQSDFIVAVDLDDRDREARILLAAAVTRDDIEFAVGEQLRTVDRVEWSSRDEAVVAQREVRLQQLALQETSLNPPPAEAAAIAMLQGLRELGTAALPWSDAAHELRGRVAFARARQLPGAPAGGWPDLGDAALAAADWLAPWLDGITRRAHLARLPLLDALQLRIGADAMRRLDALAPTHLTLPTGSRVRIDYLDELAPCASMRMQEVFGLATTPRIGGDTPVTFKLLSPAQRPLQITRDLASFWQNAYRDVRKDMRGRYPRHYWPENPLESEPTRGIKRRN